MPEVEVKTASGRLPLWWLWLGLSLLTVALATWVRLSAPGWMLLILGVVLLGFMLLHPIIHAIGARRAGRHRRLMPLLLLLSNLFFLLSFGFQVDYSDAPGSYMGFQVFAAQVLRGSADMPILPEGNDALYLGLGLGFSVALIASWVVIAILAFKRPRPTTPEALTGATTAPP